MIDPRVSKPLELLRARPRLPAIHLPLPLLRGKDENQHPSQLIFVYVMLSAHSIPMYQFYMLELDKATLGDIRRWNRVWLSV